MWEFICENITHKPTQHPDYHFILNFDLVNGIKVCY